MRKFGGTMDFWGFEGRQEMPGEGFGLFEQALGTTVTLTTAKGKTVTVEVETDYDAKDDPEAVKKAAIEQAIKEGQLKKKDKIKDASWLDVLEENGNTKAVPQGGYKVEEHEVIETPKEEKKDASNDGTTTVNTQSTGDDTVDDGTNTTGEGAGGGDTGGTDAQGAGGGKYPPPPQLEPGMIFKAGGHTYIFKEVREDGSIEVVDDSGKSRTLAIQSGEGNPAPQPNDIQQWTQTMNQVAGFLGSVGNVGVASQYAGLAFGGRYGAVNFSYSDPFNNFNGGVAGSGDPFAFGGYGSSIGGYSGADFSGTGFFITQDSSEMKRKARKLDLMISQLLAAISMGNLDAIEEALILMNLKSKTTLIEAAKEMTVSLREYEKEMNRSTDRIAGIAKKNPTGNSAEIQSITYEMQGYSMSRQAITDSLRNIFSMVEEFSNLESSLLARKERQARFYQWA